jgi:hypothetical protein
MLEVTSNDHLDTDTIPHDSDDHDRDRGDGASRCTRKIAGTSGPARRLSLVVTVACLQFRRRKSAAVRFPSAGRWPEKVLTVSSRPDLISEESTALSKIAICIIFYVHASNEYIDEAFGRLLPIRASCPGAVDLPGHIVIPELSWGANKNFVPETSASREPTVVAISWISCSTTRLSAQKQGKNVCGFT